MWDQFKCNLQVPLLSIRSRLIYLQLLRLHMPTQYIATAGVSLLPVKYIFKSCIYLERHPIKQSFILKCIKVTIRVRHNLTHWHFVVHFTFCSSHLELAPPQVAANLWLHPLPPSQNSKAADKVVNDRLGNSWRCEGSSLKTSYNLKRIWRLAQINIRKHWNSTNFCIYDQVRVFKFIILNISESCLCHNFQSTTDLPYLPCYMYHCPTHTLKREVRLDQRQLQVKDFFICPLMLSWADRNK